MPDENQELLNIKTRRLKELRKQQATFGPHTPAHISMEIETLEAEIRELRQESGLPPAEVVLPTQGVPRTPLPTAAPEPAPAPPDQKGDGKKWWIPIVVALIGLAGVIFTTVWGNPFSPVEPPEEEMQPAEFTYEVHVVSVAGENLPEAHVMIQVAGKAPLDEVTDVNGFARFFIESSYAREPARLIVEKEGFHPHTQEIDLYPDRLPDRIPLEPTEP